MAVPILAHLDTVELLNASFLLCAGLMHGPGADEMCSGTVHGAGALLN